MIQNGHMTNAEHQCCSSDADLSLIIACMGDHWKPLESHYEFYSK